MKVNLYKQLVKDCATEAHLISFLADMNITAEMIIDLGKKAKKARKAVHPDFNQLEGLESGRLIALMVFLSRYADEIRKLDKVFDLQPQDIEQLFELLH